MMEQKVRYVNEHSIVSEVSFRPTLLNRLLEELRESRTTGTLIIVVNQGGIRTVRFREERRISLDTNAPEK